MISKNTIQGVEMRVLIIIPAYNEEKNLPKLLLELKQKYPLYDVVVINDCSKDNTLKVCRDLNIAVVDLPANLGIGGAVQTGYRYANYKEFDVAVQVDGDGQHNPDYIEVLVEGIKNGSNICIGSRFIEHEGFQSSLTRRAGIRFFSNLIRFVTKQNITDPTSGFRACDKSAIRLFAGDYPKDYPEPETIVSACRHNLKITEVPVVMNERKAGKSSITAFKSIYYMIKVSMAIIVIALSTKERRGVKV
jgi:glycosyltransferase involved in cell wall biosynthesis